MKFDHAVKYKGVFYSTGAEVPVEAEKPSNKEAKAEPKKTTAKK
jgi:hypothetical protein